MKQTTPVIDYHKLRMEKGPAFARSLVKIKLKEFSYNISRTAIYFGITRKTVRRAFLGVEKDQSRRPKNSPNKTPEHLEKLIVHSAKLTGFSYRRLSYYMMDKYGIHISENTIKKILKRKGIAKTRKKRRGKTRRRLYNYEKLLPFSHMQLDTKYILDKKSLPKAVYEHVKAAALPLYEWNMIDVKTRIKFTAYSYSLNSSYGFLFIAIALMWIRMHGVNWGISIRLDNGSEFCGGSERKRKGWEEKLKFLNVKLRPITPGHPYMNGIVESYHRLCDEYFLIPHIGSTRDVREFMVKAQRWQDTWNWYRRHGGIGVGGKTPIEKLKETGVMIHEHIGSFPVLLMEEWMMGYDLVMKFTNSFLKTGYYVQTKCLIKLHI